MRVMLSAFHAGRELPPIKRFQDSLLERGQMYRRFPVRVDHEHRVSIN